MSPKTYAYTERYRDDYLVIAPHYSAKERRDPKGKITWSPIGLTQKHRNILQAIIGHLYTKNYSFPSQEKIFGCTGIPERTMRRLLRELEALDLLITSKRDTPNGNKVNEYRLDWEAYFERVEYYGRDDELAALRAKRASDGLTKEAEAYLKSATEAASDRPNETTHRPKRGGVPATHSGRRSKSLEVIKELKRNGSDLDLAKGSISLPTDEPYTVSKLAKQYLASMRAGLKTQASTPPSKVIIEPEPSERAISSSLDDLITQNSEQTEWQTPQNPQT